MRRAENCIIALMLMAQLLILLKVLEDLSKKRMRQWWIKPHLHPILRDRYGAFSTLFVYFALNSQEDFHDFIHMDLDSFIELYELVHKKLLKKSWRKPLRPELRLVVVLHYLAHGGCAKNEAWLFFIGRSTVYAIIPEVCKILNSVLIPKYVKFPTKKDWLQIANGFEKLWNFPNCIGALDGKHFKIGKPPNSGAQFKNYKKYDSIVLLATCDATLRITWFNLGDYGSFSDTSVFAISDLAHKLRSNEANIPFPRQLPNSSVQTTFVFVADEIFGLNKNLMKPFARKKLLSKEEKIFNYRLSRARWTIECAFGIMTEKWEVLQKSLSFKLETCDKIITTIIGLHNFLLSRKNPLDKVINDNYPTTAEIDSIALPNIIRNRLKDYFSSPQGAVPWQKSYIV